MSRLLFNSPSVYRQRHVQSPSRMQIGEGINDGCTTRQQLKLAGPAWGERFHARVGGSKPRKVDLSQTLRYKPSAASFLPVRIFGFVFVKRFHHKSHVTGPHTAGSIDFPLSASPTEFQHHLCDGKAMRKRGRLVRLPSSSRDTNTGATQAETGTILYMGGSCCRKRLPHVWAGISKAVCPSLNVHNNVHEHPSITHEDLPADHDIPTTAWTTLVYACSIVHHPSVVAAPLRSKHRIGRSLDPDACDTMADVLKSFSWPCAHCFDINESAATNVRAESLCNEYLHKAGQSTCVYHPYPAGGHGSAARYLPSFETLSSQAGICFCLRVRIQWYYTMTVGRIAISLSRGKTGIFYS
ncbi:hypothetical protein M8818_001468 [Zalaria obscura]|uniref:Uncharacterized protein n=1 Tax=Zalaria obscura TaxID=2024903 RepID=A0ACC3SLW0_9PEZI